MSLGSYGRCATQRYFQVLGNIHDIELSDSARPQATSALSLGQLSVILLWLAAYTFHIGWSGNFEAFVDNPLGVLPINHFVLDPHFSQLVISSKTTTAALTNHPIYHWLYTVGFTSNAQLYRLTLSLELAAGLMLIFSTQPIATSILGTLSISMLPWISIAWAGHLVFMCNEPALAHHHAAIGVVGLWITSYSNQINTAFQEVIKDAFPDLKDLKATTHLDLSISLSILGILTSLLAQQAFVYSALSFMSYLTTTSLRPSPVHRCLSGNRWFRTWWYLPCQQQHQH